MEIKVSKKLSNKWVKTRNSKQLDVMRYDNLNVVNGIIR